MTNPDPSELISKEELTELLAEVTDSTPEEIEAGAEEIEVGPPWEGEIIVQVEDLRNESSFRTPYDGNKENIAYAETLPERYVYAGK